MSAVVMEPPPTRDTSSLKSTTTVLSVATAPVNVGGIRSCSVALLAFCTTAAAFEVVMTLLEPTSTLRDSDPDGWEPVKVGVMTYTLELVLATVNDTVSPPVAVTTKSPVPRSPPVLDSTASENVMVILLSLPNDPLKVAGTTGTGTAPHIEAGGSASTSVSTITDAERPHPASSTTPVSVSDLVIR